MNGLVLLLAWSPANSSNKDVLRNSAGVTFPQNSSPTRKGSRFEGHFTTIIFFPSRSPMQRTLSLPSSIRFFWQRSSTCRPLCPLQQARPVALRPFTTSPRSKQETTRGQRDKATPTQSENQRKFHIITTLIYSLFINNSSQRRHLEW